MKNEIVHSFEETTHSLLKALQSFDEQSINEIPFEGSWTAAQVTDHILKSQAGLPHLLGGKIESTDRNPNEKTAGIKKIFLDYGIKMKSPDFILPSLEPQDKEALIKKVEDTSKNIIEAMHKGDLNKVCQDFELPNMGLLTGSEWSWFAIYHTQRHVHQLNNIHTSIASL